MKKKYEFRLTENARLVIEKFLLRDKKGNIADTPRQMFERVAGVIAEVDKNYGGDVDKTKKEFFDVLSSFSFLPNIPVLVNSGNNSKFQQLAACFVLPVEDDLAEIFQAVKEMALIQKTGGGTGFSFSNLRPEGSIVSHSYGVASGPVSFMKVFDCASGVIHAGSVRKGANMGILSVEHPDIEKFIGAKRRGELNNFNISVSITDSFMEAVEKNKDYKLINPVTNKTEKIKKAKEIFDLICINAYYNGEPGVIFIDTINKTNPTPKEKIVATNPCGEVPLLPYEACILGSINLSSLTTEKGVDYKKLEKLVEIGVHFLDNCIDASEFPVEKIGKKVRENRKIGLGIMGFADSLLIRKIPYNSEQAVKEAGKIMKFIQTRARKKSKELARIRGCFPNIENSIFRGEEMRNATVTAIAPTGTISIIANCSESIEPIFNVFFERQTAFGNLVEFNPIFKKVLEKYKITKNELDEIGEMGTLKYSKLPNEIKKIFVAAHDVSPEYHLRIQAEFQKYTDNAVSKTVNLPFKSTVEDVKKIFLLAHKLGCKGVTIYRDKSRDVQVLKMCKCPDNY